MAHKTPDVAVVGAGAAGISAALHAAGAGLSVTLVEEQGSLGGAATDLARLEVVSGSPVGLTGQEWIDRAGAELSRAGVEVRTATRAVALRCTRRAREVVVEDGSTVRARAVIAATGADVSPVEINGARSFSGAGFYRGVPPLVPPGLVGKDAVVLGEPNAAVAAALRLARSCRSVLVLSEQARVGDHLSQDLVREVRITLNVAARPSVEVVELVGVGSLEAIVLRDRTTGRIIVRPAAALFVLDPRTPRSEWLNGALSLPTDGWVATGDAIERQGWSRAFARRRLPRETVVPRVFAAGAVRQGADPGFRGAIEEGIAAAQDAVERIRGWRAVRLSSPTGTG